MEKGDKKENNKWGLLFLTSVKADAGCVLASSCRWGASRTPHPEVRAAWGGEGGV